jgi:hypothetical protein
VGVGGVGPVGGRALVGMLGLVLGLGVPTGLPGVPFPFSPSTTVIRRTIKGPSKGARGSPAHQRGAGTLTEQRQHKNDYTGDWMGRGGRKSISSASPRKVGSHTNKGTVKGPSRGARGSRAHQQGTGTRKNKGSTRSTTQVVGWAEEGGLLYPPPHRAMSAPIPTRTP